MNEPQPYQPPQSYQPYQPPINLRVAAMDLALRVAPNGKTLPHVIDIAEQILKWLQEE